MRRNHKQALDVLGLATLIFVAGDMLLQSPHCAAANMFALLALAEPSPAACGAPPAAARPWPMPVAAASLPTRRELFQ